LTFELFDGDGEALKTNKCLDGEILFVAAAGRCILAGAAGGIVKVLKRISFS
jgi:hypothetical protein